MTKEAGEKIVCVIAIGYGDDPVITSGRGSMVKIDLGIIKYNFEAASGHKCR